MIKSFIEITTIGGKEQTAISTTPTMPRNDLQETTFTNSSSKKKQTCMHW
jgi:hypothetical protein